MMEIFDYELDNYSMQLCYIHDGYMYDVLCDFEWLEDEYRGTWLDFKITPVKGIYFLFESGNPPDIELEITPEYCEWLLKEIRQYRDDHPMFMWNEIHEKEKTLYREDDNPQNWHYYGI